MRGLQYNMENGLPQRSADVDSPTTSISFKEELITIIDGNSLSLSRYASRLKQGGFSNVTTAGGLGNVNHTIFEDSYLTIIDLAFIKDFDTFLTFLQLARFRGHNGHVVFISEKLTCAELYRCAIIGIRDFWIKGRHLDIEKEVEYVLTLPSKSNRETLSPIRLANLGLFRTLGLTAKEIELISVLADGFPRQCQIASQLGKSASYIHKMFSRLYEKLDVTLHVDSTPQLAHLLTLCSLFK